MKLLYSLACKKFSAKLGKEVVVGHHILDDLLKEKLVQHKLSNEVKKIFGVSATEPLSMYDLTKSTFDILPLLRFIYLMSLTETFFKEYIAEREGIDIDVISNVISTEKSNWDKRKLGSSSFYNLKYSNFVIQSRYGIDFSVNVKPETMEMGILRNCIVHHDGKLISQYWIDELRYTISAKGIPAVEDTKIEIDPSLLTAFIDDLKKIVTLMDYR